LPRIAADRDAELNWLKMLVKKLTDKVNAPGTHRRPALPRWKTTSMRWLSMASA
jgi:hypothetical protein